MKKLIASAVAAGALAFGGAASAQDLGSVIANVLGFGQPTYNHGYGYPSSNYGYPNYSYGSHNQYGGNVTYPAVVAQQPYGTQNVYVDRYGRQVHIDQYGRHVLVQQPSNQLYSAGYDSYGRAIYRDAWGNHVYSNGARYHGSVYSQARSNSHWDRDGDGVANHQDRWPDDRRYW